MPLAPADPSADFAPGDRVSLITDVETEPIARSLADEVRAVGAPLEVFVLEDFGARPTTERER